MEDLSNQLLGGHLTDVPQLLQAGRDNLACPYFASRISLPLCEIVLLPYQVGLDIAVMRLKAIRGGSRKRRPKQAPKPKPKPKRPEAVVLSFGFFHLFPNRRLFAGS